MLKALYRKQMGELGSFITRDPKTGKHRTPKERRKYIILLVVLGVVLLFSFGAMSLGISPMIVRGDGWVYMSVMSLLGVLLGTFGSVFNTFAALYQAKDNEALLAMPIPEKYIVLVRMAGVFIMGSIYSAFVTVPAYIILLIFSRITFARVVFGLLNILTVSLIVLVLSCVLGWVIAKISAKLKNKSAITIILSVAFLAAYFWFCGNNGRLMVLLSEDSTGAIRLFRGGLFLFGWCGRGADGSGLLWLAVTVLFAALGYLVWMILSRSFLRLCFSGTTQAKAEYKEKAAKVSGIGKALLRREAKRFVSSPVYVLNAAFGTLLMPAAAVVLVWKAGTLRSGLLPAMSQSPVLAALLPVILLAVLCLMTTMVEYTAPSISLEGKTLWLLQSFPVDPWDVLMAKVKMHMLLTVPPLLLCAAATVYAFAADIGTGVLITVSSGLFALDFACLGLIQNLKKPNFTWTSESAPVKQSGPAMLCMFGGWAAAVILVALYALLRSFLPASVYLTALAVIMALLARYELVWLKKKGVKLFAEL